MYLAAYWVIGACLSAFVAGYITGSAVQLIKERIKLQRRLKELRDQQAEIRALKIQRAILRQAERRAMGDR